MGNIVFNRIPSSLRVSVVLAEADNSGARGGVSQPRTLLVGQRTSAGSVAEATPVLVTSKGQAATYFGSGSMLHRMFIAAFLNDPGAEFWAVALDDHASGAQAGGTLTFTGPATETGTLFVWIGGTQIPVTVLSGDAATDVAAALVAAITADATLPVTAAVGGSGSEHIVTVTAKNDGTLGNGIDIRVNFLDGEATPAGIGVTVVAMASGATDPDITTALDALGDEPYDFIISPYTDSTSLAATASAWNDVGGRWDPTRGLYGQVFAAGKQANLSAAASFGAALNDPENHAWAVIGSPTWAPEWSAALGCAAARALKKAPGASHSGERVYGVVAPPMASRLTVTERNTLLYTGCSTFYSVGRGRGRTYLDTTITTYQTDEASNADESWLLAQTRRLVTLIQRDAASSLYQRFKAHSLASDDTPAPPGLKVATPAKVKGHLSTRHDVWINRGWCQGTTSAFVESLLVEPNEDTSTRFDVRMQPRLTQPLNQIALQNRFLTRAPQGV